jgi:DNA ligase D-like protein (predicted 3'-phosphoesterase)
MSGKGIRTYLDKRDFRRTAEPTGSTARSGTRPVFVVQRHDASTEHYDFRLEVDGALESWAVPKGPSTDPSEKRLAVRTEPHPLDYADFEGVIPDEEYGGGTVLVWDAGSYRNLKQNEAGNEGKSMAECLADGHLTVWLAGEKLTGGYALTRLRERRDAEQWLLVKMNDDEADARRNPVSTERRSVLTGRSLAEIGAAERD